MADPKKWRILNVDDNEAGRYAVTRILKKAGFDVIEAANGADALTLATDQHPDLVLLDVNLPDISGLEVCKRLKADEKTAFIPVVHLSATFIHSQERVQGLEGGADGYLVHPIEPEELVATIRSFIRIRSAELALQESEMRYRRLFESAKDGILILNRDTGGIIDANPFISSLAGYAREELIGKKLWEIGFFSDQVASKLSFEELQKKEYIRYDDLLIETKEGKRIEVEFTSTIYPLDQTQSVIQCSIRDISSRKRAEKNLRETTEYLNNLLDYANAPIIVWDPKFRITRFNHAFEHLTGRTEQAVLGQNLALLFPEQTRNTSLERIEKTLAGERWEVVEIPILHISGETRVVLWNSANIVDPQGTIISTIAQGQDITDRKLTEHQRETLIKELEKKNAELGLFSRTISHELKSPLITIRGFISRLEQDLQKNDAARVQSDITRIAVAAETMQALLSDILSLSLAGKIIQSRENIEFGSIVQEALDTLAIPLGERNIRVEVAPDLPVVYIDRLRIREVMVNILENALKFLGKQQNPLIRIGVDITGEIPVFFVQDNGIGIDSRYLDRIFNLFERLDASAPGTGFGLTFARRIIEIHGGKIWAESVGVGKGTTFRFTLPAGGERECP